MQWRQRNVLKNCYTCEIVVLLSKHVVDRRRILRSLSFTVGSLSIDDGNGNENGKKAIGLDWQNNFARASRLLVYLLTVVARLQRKTS